MRCENLECLRRISDATMKGQSGSGPGFQVESGVFPRLGAEKCCGETY